MKTTKDEISKEYSVLFNGITQTINALQELTFHLMVLQDNAESLFISKEDDNNNERLE